MKWLYWLKGRPSGFDLTVIDELSRVVIKINKDCSREELLTGKKEIIQNIWLK